MRLQKYSTTKTQQQCIVLCCLKEGLIRFLQSCMDNNKLDFITANALAMFKTMINSQVSQCLHIKLARNQAILQVYESSYKLVFTLHHKCDTRHRSGSLVSFKQQDTPDILYLKRTCKIINIQQMTM